MRKKIRKNIYLFNVLKLSVTLMVFITFVIIINTGFNNHNVFIKGDFLKIRVVGTANVGEKMTALLEDQEKGTQGFYREGDKISGYEILSISEEEVKLAAGNKRYAIGLFSSKELPSVFPEQAESDDVLYAFPEEQYADNFVADDEFSIDNKESFAKYTPKKYQAVSNNSFIFPLRGRLTSGFGYRQNPMGGSDSEFHPGWDISAKRYTPIKAAAEGKVILSGWYSGYGYCVILRHANGYESRYGHMSKRLVEKGDTVAQGDAIGQVGSSGRSTGPHLHFEVRKNGKVLNPGIFLSK